MRVASLGATGRGAHAALAALERDGLVALTQPLKGQASAYRTTRVVTLTAQGLDIAAADPSDGAGARSASGSARRWTCCSGAPDGLDAARPAARRASAPRRSTRLATLGLVAIARRRVERDPFDASAPRAGIAADAGRR